MKLTKYLSILAICTMTTACNSSRQQAVLTSGIDLANLDTTVVAGENFYDYACGGWMQLHPLTDEYSRFGSFDLLRENNREQLRQMIEQIAAGIHASGSVPQKIGDLYNIAMNEEKLNNQGVAPIQNELDAIAQLKSNDEIYRLLAHLQRRGINPYFVLYVSADNMNSDMNMVHTYQAGLGLGERDYYLKDDEAMKKIREAYKAHVEKMFVLAGYDETQARQGMEAVMRIETRIAESSRSNTELRDPRANFNRRSAEELATEYPTFQWTPYFTEIGLNDLKEISVGQPAQMQEVANIIATAPLEDQKAYLQWNVINEAAAYLSDDFVNQNFDFYGKTLSGKQELQPRWKRAVSSVDGALGEAVGQMYVEEYFPPAAKTRMVELVGNLQTALGERIQALDWMSDETKSKAMEKLATFHVKVGYPDKWKDYSTLIIQDDSYWGNIERASLWEFQEMIDKAGKPVDKDEWHMNPQTVNAYYNPTTNEICFPAGILQYPFFDMNADDAFNYGAIGVVIGHEMTHGFDDMGRQFDKDGNLNDWWTEEDSKKFDERSKVLVSYYDSIQVAPGVYANGSFTLGENIADQGGLHVSYQALHNAMKKNPLGDVDGFSPDQRFYLAYANLWAGNIRDEEVLRLTQMDEHSLGRWRVNGALPHVDTWYEAFGIDENAPMYISPDKRASIW